MKPEKPSIVEVLKEKHRVRLARADEALEKESVENYADISLLQKWAYRVGEGWYGFSLGDIPAVWRDVLDDFLIWVESQCPNFEIHQIKMKFGGLRFYIDTKSEDAAVNERVRAEVSELEKLLRHEKHRQH